MSQVKKPPFELLHALVCDDVRVEAHTNKRFYIGVYNGVIISSTDPVLLDRLAFVFTIRETSKDAVSKYRLEFDCPEGMSLPTFEDPSYTGKPDAKTHTVTLFIQGASFVAGDYTARLLINDFATMRLPFTVIGDPEIAAKTRVGAA